MRSKPTLLIGLGLIGLSVLFYRQLEIHSFDSTSDFQFTFLEYMWFPVLAAGVVLTAIGCFLFGRKANPKTLAAWGIVGIAVPVMTDLFRPNAINVHTWTAIFLGPLLFSFVFGSIFIIAGLVRFVIARRRND
jgi:ABC-type Mn2+/Zn2+ transport system permease subunit